MTKLLIHQSVNKYVVYRMKDNSYKVLIYKMNMKTGKLSSKPKVFRTFNWHEALTKAKVK